ncbi:MAG: hypothetical protein WBP12_00355 [Candidatus Saccharimonas sp.]
MPAQVSLSTKRKAIADSNRMMFIWVAGMSAVVGACVVVAIFLGQQIAFRAQVISEMTNTVSVLSNNNKAVGDLADNIRVFETNEALNSVKSTPEEKALQVILDALPADRNTLALGASLQQILLTGVDGLSIDKIVVDTDSRSSDVNDVSIPVQIQVSSTSASALKDMLVRMERSIRTIDVTGLEIERSDVNGQTRYQMTVDAVAYYEPAVEVKLMDKVVPDNEKK